MKDISVVNDKKLRLDDTPNLAWFPWEIKPNEQRISEEANRYRWGYWLMRRFLQDFKKNREMFAGDVVSNAGINPITRFATLKAAVVEPLLSCLACYNWSSCRRL